jgi:hypothetical protein
VNSRILKDSDFDGYDKLSGQLSPTLALFGSGIAFPQDVIDGANERHPWVGFKRSIEQVDIMMDTFLEAKNRKP